MAALLSRLFFTALSGVQEAAREAETTSLIDTESRFDVWPAFFNMLMALAVVIGLIVLISWLLRKFSGNRMSLGTNSFLRIVTTLPMGNQRYLAVVRAGKRYFLIGTTAGQFQNLGELKADEVEEALKPEDGDQHSRPFANVLQRVMGKSEEGK